MAFHAVRFPAGISLGASGGPERRTEIVVLGSGAEERNSRWGCASCAGSDDPALASVGASDIAPASVARVRKLRRPMTGRAGGRSDSAALHSELDAQCRLGASGWVNPRAMTTA